MPHYNELSNQRERWGWNCFDNGIVEMRCQCVALASCIGSYRRRIVRSFVVSLADKPGDGFTGKFMLTTHSQVGSCDEAFNSLEKRRGPSG